MQAVPAKAIKALELFRTSTLLLEPPVQHVPGGCVDSLGVPRLTLSLQQMMSVSFWAVQPHLLRGPAWAGFWTEVAVGICQMLKDPHPEAVKRQRVTACVQVVSSLFAHRQATLHSRDVVILTFSFPELNFRAFSVRIDRTLGWLQGAMSTTLSRSCPVASAHPQSCLLCVTSYIIAESNRRPPAGRSLRRSITP